MKAVVLNRVALVLSFAGIFVSGVLSIGAMFGANVPCGMSSGCETVAAHPSSHLLGINNAYLGLMGYVVLAALSYLRLVSPKYAKGALIAGYAITAIGTVGSLILTYISIAIIHAACPWCLTSLLLMIVLLILHGSLVQMDRGEEPDVASSTNLLAAGSGLLVILLLGIIGSRMVAEARSTGVDKAKLAKAAPTQILPDDVHVYGNPDAPVTIVEFGDLLCPACQEEYPKVKEFVGLHRQSVKYVFRHYPLLYKQGHEFSAPAAIASEIAAEKGLFYQFLDGMYAEKRENVTDTDPILQVAASVGLNTDETLKRMQNPKGDKAFERVMRDIRDASAVGVQMTPTFFIVAPGEPVHASSMTTLFDDLRSSEYQRFFKNG